MLNAINDSKLTKKKGFTLIELIIVMGIIGILSAIAIPAYIGFTRNATYSEARVNLESISLLAEEYFSDNGFYPPNTGTCAKNQDNVNVIKGLLPGFNPEYKNGVALGGLNFSICIENNIDFDGNAQIPCFRATAIANSDKRIQEDLTFMVDCNNRKNY